MVEKWLMGCLNRVNVRGGGGSVFTTKYDQFVSPHALRFGVALAKTDY